MRGTLPAPNLEPAMHTDSFPVLNFQDFIAADGDKLTTDSRKVAAVFRKQHRNVLRDIRNLVESAPNDFARLNFEQCYSNNDLANGKPEPYFTITRDGFALLAMGFTGKKALAFKVAYIEAFNEMASYIKNQREGLTYRLFALQLEHKGKKEKASLCGRGLNEWRGEKPVLEGALKAIEEKMNPQLELVVAKAA